MVLFAALYRVFYYDDSMKLIQPSVKLITLAASSNLSEIDYISRLLLRIYLIEKTQEDRWQLIN